MTKLNKKTNTVSTSSEVKENVIKNPPLDNQSDHFVSTQYSAPPTKSFLNSTCKDCLYWLSRGCSEISNDITGIKKSFSIGLCVVDPPSVKTNVVLKEGPLHIYPLTEENLPACSKFKSL